MHFSIETNLRLIIEIRKYEKKISVVKKYLFRSYNNKISLKLKQHVCLGKVDPN